MSKKRKIVYESAENEARDPDATDGMGLWIEEAEAEGNDGIHSYNIETEHHPFWNVEAGRLYTYEERMAIKGPLRPRPIKQGGNK